MAINGFYSGASTPSVSTKQLGRKIVAYSKKDDEESFGSGGIASDVGELRAIAKNSSDPNAGFVVYAGDKDKRKNARAKERMRKKLRLGNAKKA